MTTSPDHPDTIERSLQEVRAAAVSIHYIVIALLLILAGALTLPILAQLIFVLSYEGLETDFDTPLLVLGIALSLLLAYLNVRTARALAREQPGAVFQSTVLGLLMLLLFPVGTLLGAFLLFQLSKLGRPETGRTRED